MKRADHHRTKGATVVFFSVVLLTIFWLPDFFGFGLVPTSNGYRLLAIGLAIVNGLVLYGLGERFLSYNRSGHLMLWFYLLVVFAYPQARTFSFAFLSALLAEAGLFTLFIAAEGKGRLAPLFLAGLFTTCAGLLYWPGFIMVLVVAAGALVLRIFSLRRGLIFLGGVMLPFGGVLFYRFWVFEDIWVFGEIFSKMIGHTQPGPAPDTPAALFLMGVLVYLLLRSLLRIINISDGANALRSRALATIVIMLLFCSATAFLYAREIYGFLPLLALPVSACLSCYFSVDKTNPRLSAELYVLLLALLVNQLANLLR